MPAQTGLDKMQPPFINIAVSGLQKGGYGRKESEKGDNC